jgi:hypothetical protein
LLRLRRPAEPALFPNIDFQTVFLGDPPDFPRGFLPPLLLPRRQNRLPALHKIAQRIIRQACEIVGAAGLPLFQATLTRSLP